MEEIMMPGPPPGCLLPTGTVPWACEHSVESSSSHQRQAPLSSRLNGFQIPALPVVPVFYLPSPCFFIYIIFAGHKSSVLSGG